MINLQVKSIRSLARGLEVLLIIQASGAMRLNDLYHATGYPRASLLRILKTLVEEGVVWRRVADDAYLASYSLRERASIMDRELQLIEVSSKIMTELTNEVKWPSVLAVPRLDHMEVIETNAPQSYFHHIPLGPIGFKINMFKSAAGRAYLAFCDDVKREAILNRLRLSSRKGNKLAHCSDHVDEVLQAVRDQNYSFRDPNFGGDFDEPRRIIDDGRDSIAMPIVLGSHVPGVINLTWAKKVFTRQQIVDKHLPNLRDAVEKIAKQLASNYENFTW